MILDFNASLRSPFAKQCLTMPNFDGPLLAPFAKQPSTILGFDVLQLLRTVFAKQSPHTGKSGLAAFIGIGERILG